MKKKLLVLDIENNYNLVKKNYDIVFLSTGTILDKNCKVIKFDKIKYNNLNSYKKIFYETLKRYLNSKKNQIELEFILETEISNIRNDKTNLFDKIYFINSIKKIIKNYQIVEVIYDNDKFTDTYRSLNQKKVKLNFIGNKEKISINYFSFIFSRFKFFLRSLTIVLFSKIFLTNHKIYNKNLGLSIYPLLFNNENMSIYEEENQYVNFNITDETHIKISFFKNLINLFNLNKKKKFIIIKKKIKIFRLLQNFFISFVFYRKINSFKKKKFKLNNIDFSTIMFEYFYNSLLNRLKLEIYKEAIKETFSSRKIKNFNYYLFEYSFGFFLKNQIYKINKKIKFKGYQHGIFSKNLFWFDFVKKFKKYVFYPDEIIANNYYSREDYKKVLKSKIKKYKLKNNKKYKLHNLKISNYSKNYLIILGQHDHNQILKIFENKTFDNKFFIKPHPRSKNINFNKYKNLKKFKKNLKYKKILFSQTTTLYYDFLSKNNIKKFLLIAYDYKNNITFDFFRKKNYFYIN